MRIAIVVPFELGSLCDDDYFRSYITQPEVEKIFRAGKGYPGETSSDVAPVMPTMMEVFITAEREGFDAIIVAPHTDAGVDDGRELVRIPIIGVLGLALRICATLGHRTCVITPSLALKRWNESRIKSYGLENTVFVRKINMSVEEITPYYEEYRKSGKHGEVIERVVSEAIKAIEEDDAQVLTIGCGGMMWLVDIAREELKKRGYNIPFVNPLPTAVEVAKAMVTLGLSHSPLSYPGVKRE